MIISLEKADLIRSTMSSIQMDHTPSWAQRKGRSYL